MDTQIPPSIHPAMPRTRSTFRSLSLFIQLLLSFLLLLAISFSPISISAQLLPPTLNWDVSPRTGSRLVQLNFSVTPGVPDPPSRVIANTVQFAFTGMISDHWLPLNGPVVDNYVPTNCATPNNLAACIGGGGYFSALLQQCRKHAALTRNGTCLSFMAGDWLNGNSFARATAGSMGSSYMYLSGVDAIGLGSTEFQPELGANYTTFLNSLQNNFNGNGVPNGMTSVLRKAANSSTLPSGITIQQLNTVPATPIICGDIRVATNDQVTAAKALAAISCTVASSKSAGASSSTSTSSSSSSSSTAAATLTVDDAEALLLKLDPAVIDSMQMLAPSLPPLPGVLPHTIIDAALDIDAWVQGLCSLETSSCTRSVTHRLGVRHTGDTAADGDAFVYSRVGAPSDERVGVVTLGLDDLTAISEAAKFFELPKDHVAWQDIKRQLDLLQKEVGSLLELGVNKIIVLSPSELYASVTQSLENMYGIDVVISDQLQIQPMHYISRSISGAPMLFLSCSLYMLHWCMAKLHFDQNGVLMHATLNFTLMDINAVPQGALSTNLGQTIHDDYMAIVSNASSKVIGYKLYKDLYTNSLRGRFLETTDGSLVADSGRWISGAQIGLQNAGGVRTVLNPGPVTLADVPNLLPFENTWVRLKMSGAVLWSALENSVSLSSISDESDPAYTTAGRGRFMQVSGMRFEWNPLAPVGYKVISITIMKTPPKPSPIFDLGFNIDVVNPLPPTDPVSIARANYTYWTPVDPDEYYTVSVASFEAANGDGYLFQGNPECSVDGANLGTHQVVFESYMAQFSPIAVSQQEHRIVIDKSSYAPILLSVTPPVGDITQTNILLLAGNYLYVGNDAKNTKVTLRIPVAASLASVAQVIQTDCRVIPEPLPSRSPLTVGAAPVQLIRCIVAPPPITDASLVRSVRFFINSGPRTLNGSTSFTALNPSMFNFTAGSAADNCLRYEGTLFRNNKCICRSGYEAIDLNSTSSSNSTTVEICSQCKPGFYSEDGAVVCSKCAPGTYSASYGSTQCIPCSADSYTAVSGAAQCTPCPLNSYTDFNLAPARTRCFCKPGFLVAEDWRRLVERAAGFNISYVTESDPLPASRNSSAPAGVLPASFISTQHDFVCMACPVGAMCDPVSGDVRTTSGYWLDSATASFLECPNPENCCFQPDLVDPQGTAFYQRTDAEVIASGSCSLHSEETACDINRHGYLCAMCIDGYQNQMHSGSIGSSAKQRLSVCVKCDTANGPMVFVMALVCLAYIFFVLFSTPGSNDLKLQLISFYQMAAMCLLPGTLSVGTAAAGILQLFHLRADTVMQSSSDGGLCLLPTTSLAGIVLHALIGPMLLFSLAVIACFFYLIRHKVHIPFWRFRMAGWQLLIFGFMGTIAGAFELLGCKTIGLKSILTAAPDVECWQGSHYLAGLLAIVVSVLLVIIVPVFIFIFLRRLRLRLGAAHLADQLRAAHEKGEKIDNATTLLMARKAVAEEGDPFANDAINMNSVHLAVDESEKSSATAATKSGSTSTSSTGNTTATGSANELTKEARRLYIDAGIAQVLKRAFKRSPEAAKSDATPLQPAGAPQSQPEAAAAAPQKKKMMTGGKQNNTDMHALSSLALVSDPKLIGNRKEGEEAPIQLNSFELLLLSHGLLFLSYSRGYRWFESLFLLRRVLYALPFALTTQINAVSIVGWYCSILLLLHAHYRVFEDPDTQWLHISSLFCIISLCWLQTGVVYTGKYLSLVAWILCLAPLVVFFLLHPWSFPLQNACRSMCPCWSRDKKKQQKRHMAEAAVIARRARKKLEQSLKADLFDSNSGGVPRPRPAAQQSSASAAAPVKKSGSQQDEQKQNGGNNNSTIVRLHSTSSLATAASSSSSSTRDIKKSTAPPPYTPYDNKGYEIPLAPVELHPAAQTPAKERPPPPWASPKPTLASPSQNGARGSASVAPAAFAAPAASEAVQSVPSSSPGATFVASPSAASSPTGGPRPIRDGPPAIPPPISPYPSMEEFEAHEASNATVFFSPEPPRSPHPLPAYPLRPNLRGGSPFRQIRNTPPATPPAQGSPLIIPHPNDPSVPIIAISPTGSNWDYLSGSDFTPAPFESSSLPNNGGAHDTLPRVAMGSRVRIVRSPNGATGEGSVTSLNGESLEGHPSVPDDAQ